MDRAAEINAENEEFNRQMEQAQRDAVANGFKTIGNWASNAWDTIVEVNAKNAQAQMDINQVYVDAVDEVMQTTARINAENVQANMEMTRLQMQAAANAVHAVTGAVDYTLQAFEDRGEEILGTEYDD